MANNSEMLLVVTAVAHGTKDTAADNNVAHTRQNDDQQAVTATNEQTINTNLQAVEKSQPGQSGLLQDDRLVVDPSLYWKKFNRHIMAESKIDKTTPVDGGVENIKSDSIVNSAIYQPDINKYEFC